MVVEAEDVDDAGQDHSASLARLRLFLAPHSSSKGESSDPQQQPSLSSSSSDANESHDQDRAQAQSTSCANDADPEAEVDDDDSAVSGQVTIPAPGAVASVSPLSHTTKDFSRVKYLLQCCLPGFRVHDDVMVWDMTNPSLVAQYEQHAHGLLELDSWVAVNDLGAAMGDVHSYGFTSLDANQSGMKFTTGNLQLGLPVAKQKGTRQLVLCKIAVGRSLVIRSEDEAKKRLPMGYNSFYLKLQQQQQQQQQHERASEDESVADTERGYYHEYILNNTRQILPQFLVRFRFSAMGSKSAGPCALCEKHPAAVLCRACEAEICSACDQEVHSANKLVSRHKRVPLRQKAKSQRDAASARATRRRSSTPPVPMAASTTTAAEDCESHASSNAEAQDENVDAMIAKQLEEGLADIQTTCRFHEGKRVEFYCSVCEAPVCVHCKMVGDHSVGEKGSHRLLTIADAYELSLRESLKSDPLIESRKSVIENKLFALARSRADVLRNKEQVEAAIRLQCQQALDRLEDEVRSKVSVLDGEALEFQRQLQQIEWTEDTLEDLRASCPAVEFLGSWNQHKAVRTEQRDFPAFAHGSSAEQVKGDLELVGRLQVVSGEEISLAVNGDGSEASSSSRLNSSRTSRFGHDATSAALRGNSFSSESSEIRKKLLSMKAAIPSECSHPLAGSGSSSAAAHFNPSATVLSLQGMQMIEEIRSELLARSSLPKSSSSRTATFTSHAAIPSPSAKSARHFPPTTPTRTAMGRMDMASTLRGLSIQPSRMRASGGGQQSPVTGCSRLVSDAWSTLLRHEMALASPAKDEQ